MIVSRGEILTACGLTASGDTLSLGLVNMVHPFAERMVKNFLGFEVEQQTFSEYYPEENYHAPQDPLITGYEQQGGRATPVERFADERRVIQLRQLPVRSIVSIYEDDNAWVNGSPPSFGSSTLLTNADFQVDFPGNYSPGAAVIGQLCWSGFVFRLSGIWTATERCIQVAYIGGLTATEIMQDFPDIRMAVVIAAQQWYNQLRANRVNPITGTPAGPVTSESINGLSMSYDATTQRVLQGMFGKLPPAAMQILGDYQRYSKYI